MSPSSRASRPSPIYVWLSTLRPRTLPAALVPVMVGTALAASRHMIDWQRAMLCGVCALLIQIGTNLYNDYADFKRGADTPARLGPARASQRGWLSPRAVQKAALAAFGAALLSGAYLVWVAGWPILLLGLLSIAMGFCYTGGPYPLAYHGLGEAFVFAFFGLCAVGGTHFVLTDKLPSAAIVTGASIGALACAILVVNNLRDIRSDAAVGKVTLAVRLGPRLTQVQYVLLVLAAYALPVAWVGLGHGHPSWLLILLSLPMAVRACYSVCVLRGASLNKLLGSTALLELAFGLLLCAGMLW